MQFVFPTSRVKHFRFPTHVNDLVVDRADSRASEVFVVVLEPGEAPPPHKHDDTEQVFYILEGEGILRTGTDRQAHVVRPTDIVRIPPTVRHSIQCTGEKPLRYIAVDCFVGGRPEAEPTWDSHVQVMCRQQGWNYEAIAKQT